jgi:hypothetical protein
MPEHQLARQNTKMNAIKNQRPITARGSRAQQTYQRMRTVPKQAEVNQSAVKEQLLFGDNKHKPPAVSEAFAQRCWKE